MPARRFDDDDENRWSVEQFGSEADTMMLEAVVERRIGGRWKVLVVYDNTWYTLEPAALHHSRLTRPRCSAETSDIVPISEPETADPVVSGSGEQLGLEAPHSHRDAHDGGGGMGNDDNDLDAPLFTLARIAAASSPAASTTSTRSSLSSEEDSGGTTDTPPPASRPRRPRVAATGAIGPLDVVAEWVEDDCPTSST